MIVEQWIKSILILTIVTIIQPTYVKVSMAQIENKSVKKVFYFGYSTDAYPISSQDNNSELAQDTFCFALLQRLKEKYPNYEFKEYPTPIEKRLEKEPEKGINLAVGCDPYSITNQRRQYLKSLGSDFSIPYFITGFKYIVRKDQRKIKDALINSRKNNLDFNEIGINDDQKIGVIENTTPHNYLDNTDTIYNFELFPRRRDVVKVLKDDNSKIVVHITDELLLKGMLVTDLSLREKYELIPEKTLNVDMMGVIIHNPIFQYEINTWIERLGREWIVKKDQELDRQLILKNIKDYLEANFKYIKITIIIVILGGIVVYCFLIWQRNKFRKRAVPNLPTETTGKKPEASIITTIYHLINNITHLGYNTMNNNDQSQKLNISGDMIGSDIHLESNPVINQNSNNKSQELIQKLEQIEKIIQNEPTLNTEQTNEVLEEIEYIKKATQNPNDEPMKRQAKSAWKYLKGLPAGLESANKTVEQINKLLPYIQTFFGF